MQKLNTMVVLMAIMLMASCKGEMKEANYKVIPLPQEVVLNGGNAFVLNENVSITLPQDNEMLKRNAEFLRKYIEELTCIEINQTNGTAGKNIELRIDDNIAEEEGYKIVVDEDGVVVAGKTAAGVFYGIQTLRKSIPAGKRVANIALPAVEIRDYPRFGYRGMHLDVARHFFSTDFVKRYIDILALHNINTFHWHLTDDQGWRIEIKKYPKLVEIGSERSRTVIGRNSGEFDNTPYGGNYTQEEIKDIIKYAADRYVTIIPEIDLPGHMLAALAAYPQFGCTGGPYEVEPTWGIFPDVICIGNEDALVFLENVLDEVTDLFPSEYVHIGGDEAPRDRWKVCPKCQARIRAEHLTADGKHKPEDRLQTFCARRMETFLNKKGRRIIGWDEILEGDVAPNATIMSWRGMDGGIKAARMGHDVIMVPTSHGYFDYYQTDKTEDEPLSIGGYISLEKVYSLEPVPSVLSDEEKKHIIGVQANLWTEYIASPEHVEYMVLPRMAALAEVQWTVTDKKNYQDFMTRLPRLMEIYDAKDYRYGTHAFDIRAEFKPKADEKSVEITLSTVDDAPIYYTLNGDEPTIKSAKYDSPLAVSETAQFKAVAIRPASGPGRIVTEDIEFNKATTKPIVLKRQPSDKYRFNGPSTLVDGLRGDDNYSTGRWLGFIGGDMEAVIELENPTEIRRVNTQAIVDMSAWIMGSTGLVVAVSDDDRNFREVATRDYPADTDIGKHSVDKYEVSFDPVTTRYVKVIVKRSPVLPKGHNGEGTAPYMFIDEIAIY